MSHVSLTPDIEPCAVHRTYCSHACRSIHQFAESLGNAIDAKDPHTRRHSEEVAVLAFALALECGAGLDEACAVHIAGHLHDLGKIAVPDCILRKEGPLTEAEWEIMREHPGVGARIVGPVAALNHNHHALSVADMILHHHERFDGGGYPSGLTGESIPFGARVLAVADCVSAMMQHRTYRQGRSLTDAVREVSRQAGRQFDPEVAATLPGVVAAVWKSDTGDDARFFPLVAVRWGLQRREAMEAMALAREVA